MNRTTVYIVSAVRTPIGKFGGGLADFTAPDLGVIAVRAALERAFQGELPPERQPGVGGKIEDSIKQANENTITSHLVGNSSRGTASAVPKRSENSGVLTPDVGTTSRDSAPREFRYHVDELIFGNARPAGVGPNPARQIAWRAALGDDVPAFTVNMACASGLRSILLGWQEILLGNAEIVVAGGAESMSRVPYLVEARWGVKMGNQPLVDAMYRDGFLCPISQMIMGETAELLAQQYKIPREEQDAFALESHHRAARAQRECRFSREIIPVERTDKKGNVVRVEKDEHVRPDITPEQMAKLPPVFSKTGTITAGNASGITDGASCVVLASENKVRELNLKPIARIVDAAVAAVDPRVMGIGPVPAVRKLLARTRTNLDDFAAIELNEAFAAQVLACDRDLHFTRERLNPNGGAIALGHPIACTGARIITTLLHEMRRDENFATNKKGLATLCVSGGMGVAVEIETV
ncbi:MAG TPA: thiolase family protein [Candidatus Acidoferrales bacterium]|nr:thiolase family protein [Candidatus Acidoferrales bacterium]